MGKYLKNEFKCRNLLSDYLYSIKFIWIRIEVNKIYYAWLHEHFKNARLEIIELEIIPGIFEFQ